MAKRIGIASDREYLELFRQYCDNFKNSTPINTQETSAQRLRRVAMLEANPEEWFKYYFPNFAGSELQ